MKQGTSSVPILGILGLVFAIAKILGYLAWSWWLVLLPIYGPVVIVGILAFLLVLLR